MFIQNDFMEWIALFIPSGEHHDILTNTGLAELNSAAILEFSRLQEFNNGFSFWFGARYLVELETEQNPDGLHFQWPETISKVDMVKNGLESCVKIFFQFLFSDNLMRFYSCLKIVATFNFSPIF